MSIDRVFSGGSEVLPSRSGPWTKACGDCALKPGDPQGLGTDAQDDVRNLVACGQMTFFCLHRDDGRGRHRVCASADAISRAATERAA